MNRVSVAFACAFLLVFTVQKADAQSARAYERANCNASFLNNCGEGGGSVSGAPGPLLGGMAVGALIGGVAWRAWSGRRKDRADTGRTSK